MLSNKIINFMKERIDVNTYEPQFSSNCFLYAINCDVSSSEEITYVDDQGEMYYGYNLGEVSDSCKSVRTKDEFRTSFLKDCEILEIDVRPVSEDYELTDENEWLVALYYTKPFAHKEKIISDFHFIKKNFGEETWTHKPPCDVIRKKDMNRSLITSPTNFVWYARDNNHSRIDYKYIDTYCLRRKKDLTKNG